VAQRLEQQQREEQVQQLSALQVAMARLLELPVADLEERVRNEMDDNEAIEEAGGDFESDEATGEGEEIGEEAAGDGELGDRELPETSDEVADYLTDDDVPDYLLRQQNATEEREFQLSAQGNSYDDLFRQIGEHDLTPHESTVLEYIIGSLDNDGYLRKDGDTLADEMAVYQNIDTDKEEIERLLGILHTFEPHGIGARSLQECLRLQLDTPDCRSDCKDLALRLVDKHFKEFAAHHWEVVQRRMKIDDNTFERVLQLLTRLNPRPGSALNDTSSASVPTVIPDFYVHVDDAGLPVVTLNNGNVPELRVSRAFRDTLKEYGTARQKLTPRQKDELLYARKKVGDAQLFISLVQRRRTTLLDVMRAIVQLQKDFFVADDDESLLVPMGLKDVADRAGVDISTASRVTTSKYVQTDYGVYPLKFFFSSQFTAGSGEELSARQVRAALKELVEDEDKRHPFNDDELAAKLKEKGFPISRRTVSKYRDLMNIPVARLRKK